MSRFKNAFLGILMAIESLFTISCSNYKILSVELSNIITMNTYYESYYENSEYTDIYKKQINGLEVIEGSVNGFAFNYKIVANYDIKVFPSNLIKYQYDNTFIQVIKNKSSCGKDNSADGHYNAGTILLLKFLKPGQTTINIIYNEVQMPFKFDIKEFNKTDLEVYEIHSQLSDEQIGFNEHAICYAGVLFSVTDNFDYKDIFDEEFFEDNCLIYVILEKYDCYDSYPTCDIMLENKNIYVRTNIKLKKGADISISYHPATGDMTYLYYPISKDSIYIKDNWHAVDRSKTMINFSYLYL